VPGGGSNPHDREGRRIFESPLLVLEIAEVIEDIDTFRNLIDLVSEVR
jgi:hypothetical protein